MMDVAPNSDLSAPNTTCCLVTSNAEEHKIRTETKSRKGDKKNQIVGETDSSQRE
jgi:hypothetical protein